MNQNGMLPLIFAHLFSLSQIREVFGRQMAQDKMPTAPQKKSSREPRRRLTAIPRRSRSRRRAAPFRARAQAFRSGWRRGRTRRPGWRAPNQDRGAVDFDLERVHAARRAGVALDDMTAGERIVEAGGKPAWRGDRQRFLAEPAIARPPVTVAEDDLRRLLARAAASNGNRAAGRSQSDRAAPDLLGRSPRETADGPGRAARELGDGDRAPP